MCVRGLDGSCPVGPGATGDRLLNEPNARRFAGDWFSCVNCLSTGQPRQLVVSANEKGRHTEDELSQWRNKKMLPRPGASQAHTCQSKGETDRRPNAFDQDET